MLVVWFQWARDEDEMLRHKMDHLPWMQANFDRYPGEPKSLGVDEEVIDSSGINSRCTDSFF